MGDMPSGPLTVSPNGREIVTGDGDVLGWFGPSAVIIVGVTRANGEGDAISFPLTPESRAQLAAFFRNLADRVEGT